MEKNHDWHAKFATLNPISKIWGVVNQDVRSYIRTSKLDLYGFYVGKGYKCLKHNNIKFPIPNQICKKHIIL